MSAFGLMEKALEELREYERGAAGDGDGVSRGPEDVPVVQGPSPADETGEHNCQGQGPKANDSVDHPKHYTHGRIESINSIHSATAHLAGFEGFLVGNCLKYLYRYKFKNGREDLLKCRWYLNKLIEEYSHDSHAPRTY